MNQREILGIVFVLALFILSAFLSREFSGFIENNFEFGILGMILFVLAGIIATVAAPLSSLPLIPIAVNLWGAFLTALLSISAWLIGAVLAFLIARRFGKPLLSRLIDLEKISKYEHLLGKKQVFWDAIVLRMLIPVDILSYAIGLFSSISLKAYTLATLIGITPFAFVFAYASSGVSLIFQIAAAVAVLLALYLGYKKIKNI